MAGYSGNKRSVLKIGVHTGGNALAIGAISLIPLMGMAGGAVDLSRLYLARTRLQQACDAAVLGGRAAMGNQPWSSTAQTTADRYFTNNFNPGRYGSSNAQIRYTVGTDQIVHGAATVALPTSIMALFGFQSFNLAAECEAKLELPNADVMFVLDTTLSMSETNPGDSVNRITALKNAVRSFHATLENSRGPDTRIRYGFVPYSATVNVGTLLKPEWLVDRWTYQSRVPDGTEQVASTGSATTTTYTSWVKQSGDSVTSKYTIPPENCVAPANDSKTTSVKTNEVTGSDGTKTWDETQTINGTNYSASLSNGICTVTKTTYNNYVQKRSATQKANPNAGQVTYSTRYWWLYKPVQYDLAPLRAVGAGGTIAGGEMTAPVSNDHQPRKFTWTKINACIEERQTSPAADPENATAGSDMDVDGVPIAGNAATQWRPALPKLVFGRRQTSTVTMPAASWGDIILPTRSSSNFMSPSDNASLRAACPSYARKLEAINASTLTTYLNTLTPAGLTYHDIGFLWGLRLLSAQGLFASENQSPANGKLARHMIFMTDGDTETNIGDYDAYGLAALDRRRSSKLLLPTAAAQDSLVEQRLAGLCRVAKAKGITVWVVAFGTSLTSLLEDCANDGHALEARNAAELDEAFRNIAGRISQLRLTR